MNEILTINIQSASLSIFDTDIIMMCRESI